MGRVKWSDNVTAADRRIIEGDEHGAAFLRRWENEVAWDWWSGAGHTDVAKLVEQTGGTCTWSCYGGSIVPQLVGGCLCGCTSYPSHFKYNVTYPNGLSFDFVEMFGERQRDGVKVLVLLLRSPPVAEVRRSPRTPVHTPCL